MLNPAQGAVGAETMTAGLSWLRLPPEQKPIKSFPNRAGQTDTDDAIAFELEDAGIEVHRLELLRKTSGEVKTSVRGELQGWSFTRAWRYWIAEGPGIELAAADALYAAHPETVRIDGHCGCPSPREWFKGLAVGHYHVDSPAGLKGLADTIKAIVARAALASPRADSDERTAGEPQGAWMQTFCLPHFRVLDPDPSQILIEDIAHHLSQNVRYGGAGIRFLSVAEHSVHMARAARPEHALWALLHDASETYLHDLVRPVKRSLAGYAQAEDRIMRAVCERFGLPHEMPREVKRLDNRILIDETRQNMRPSDVTWSFGGETEPLGVTLQYWTPEQAEREFLATFAAITGRPVTMPATPAQPAGAVPDSLREALEFYATQWNADCDAVLIGPGVNDWSGGSVGYEATEALSKDAGARARKALRSLASHPAGQSETAEPDPTLTYWIESETERLCNLYPEAAYGIAEFREELVGLMEGNPAGQSAGSEAGEVKRAADLLAVFEQCVSRIVPENYAEGYRDALRHVQGKPASKPVPDSTRTGQGGETSEVRAIAELLRRHDGTTRIRSRHYDTAREIAATLAARPAAPEAQGARSFDMDAAPQDGTRVLLWMQGCWIHPVIGYRAFSAPGSQRDCWREHGSRARIHRVDCWQPIPAPPASSGQEG